MASVNLKIPSSLPPNVINVYSFVKGTYGVRDFTYQNGTIYQQYQITNMPTPVYYSPQPQIIAKLPVDFYVEAIYMGDLEINTAKVESEYQFSYVDLGKQSAVAIKGLGKVFLWLYRPNQTQYEISPSVDLYLYDAYLHSLRLHSAIYTFLQNGIEVPDEFFEETGLNEVVYYLNHQCTRNPYKLALGMSILQSLGISLGVYYASSPIETFEYYYENAPVCSSLLENEVSELSANLSEFEVQTSEQFSQLQNEFTAFKQYVSEQFSYQQSEISTLQSEFTAYQLYTSEQLAYQQSEITNLQNEFYAYQQYTSEQFAYLQSEIVTESEELFQLSEFTVTQFSLTETQIQNLQNQINVLYQQLQQLIAQNSEAQFNLYFSPLTKPSLNNMLTILNYLVQHYNDTYLGEGLSQGNLMNWVYAVIQELIATNFQSITGVASQYPCYAQETQTLQTYLNQSVSSFVQQLYSFVQSQTKNFLGQQQEGRMLTLLGIVLEYIAIYGDYYVRNNNTSEFLSLMSDLVTQGLYYGLGVKTTFNFKYPYGSEAYVQGAIIQSACNHKWLTFNANKIVTQYTCFKNGVITLYDSYENFTSIATNYFSIAQRSCYEPLSDLNLYFATELLLGTLLEDAYALSKLGYPPACPTQQNVQNANNSLGGILSNLVSALVNLTGSVLGDVLGLLNSILGLL